MTRAAWEESGLYKILVVEDDLAIAAAIQKALCQWGFEAQKVEDFRDVLGAFRAFAPHLVLMDVSLPFYNGFYWCGEIRKQSKAPVVFLSSRSEDMDIVMAVNMGADDYIAKPINMDVLIAKIQAMLRRSYDYAEQESALSFRGAMLDAGRSCVRLGERQLELTRNELRILQLLLENKGRIVSRERIMLFLWDSMDFIDENTLTVNVNRLRKKLSEFGLSEVITTHKGQGYAIDEDVV